MFYVKLAYAIAAAIILLYFFYIIFTLRKQTSKLANMQDRTRKTPSRSMR